MKISSNKLVFQEGQVYQELLLQNHSLDTLIFKIKITDTELFTIAPGKGFLNMADKINIKIMLMKNINFQAKLLIAYAKCQVNSSQTFDDKWKVLQKNEIQNCLVKIQRNITKTIQMQELEQSKVVQFKRTQSPILEPICQQNILKKSQSNHYSKGFKSLSQQNLENLKSLESSYIINPLKNSKKQVDTSKILNKQRQINEKMRQRLLQNERKLRYYEELNQIQINSTLNRQNSNEKTLLINIAIGIFICLLVGYFLTRINPSEQMIK